MESILNAKLAVIGAGSIARSHIEAAKEAGFILYGMCGKEGSERALQLANEFKFVKYFSNYKTLLNSEFDAVSLIASTDVTMEILVDLIPLGKPVLVEKPVTTSIKNFERVIHNHDQIIVGYNRRFYSSIQAMKEKIKNQEFHFARLNISEISWNPEALLSERRNAVLENSVHSLDLVKFLFGTYNIEKIERNIVKNELNSILILLRNYQHKLIEITISFGVPTNNCIEVWFPNNIAICKPIEDFTEYFSMKMVPPSKEVTYKRYIPEEVTNWKMSEADQRFKPGFLEQYREFLLLVNGKNIANAARIGDAKDAIYLASMALGDD
jgi:predicted dehydrogenase